MMNPPSRESSQTQECQRKRGLADRLRGGGAAKVRAPGREGDEGLRSHRTLCAGLLPRHDRVLHLLRCVSSRPRSGARADADEPLSWHRPTECCKVSRRRRAAPRPTFTALTHMRPRRTAASAAPTSSVRPSRPRPAPPPRCSGTGADAVRARLPVRDVLLNGGPRAPRRPPGTHVAPSMTYRQTGVVRCALNPIVR